MGNSYQPSRASITHTRSDFLENDGGLSAILNTVTVKFDTEQLKEMIEYKINQSDLPQNKKLYAISVIKNLPAESIKHLTTRALNYGLDNMVALTELLK